MSPLSKRVQALEAKAAGGKSSTWLALHNCIACGEMISYADSSVCGSHLPVDPEAASVIIHRIMADTMSDRQLAMLACPDLDRVPTDAELMAVVEAGNVH